MLLITKIFKGEQGIVESIGSGHVVGWAKRMLFIRVPTLRHNRTIFKLCDNAGEQRARAAQHIVAVFHLLKQLHQMMKSKRAIN